MMQKFFSLQHDPEDLGITFAADDFEPASLQDREDFYAKAPSVSYWKDAWRRLKSNKVAMVSLVFLIFVVIFAFLGPLFVKGDYKLGRNILTRVMYGTRVSLIVGIFASLIVLVIGSIYGAVSGYFGGIVDSIMMRILDLIYSVPDVLVVILISIAINKPLKDWVNNSGSQFAKKIGVLGPALISIFIVFGLLYWVGMARIIRGQVLMLKEQEFITAVRALGGSKKRIIKRHIFPNCIGQIIVMTAMQIPSAIFLESFLSFLGIGVSAPMTSLGAMAADALGGIYSYAYRLVIPSILLSLIILSLNLFSDGLRDALDPRLKK